MKFFSIFATVLSMVAIVLANSRPVMVTWDGIYDQPWTSIYSFSCGDYLKNKGITMLDMISTWPDIGAASAITGWNSPNCGRCYELSYAPTGLWIIITAISTAQGNQDFVISKSGLDYLTGGKADAMGSASVTAVLVPCPK